MQRAETKRAKDPLQHRHPMSGENGFVLVSGLVFVAILSILGVAAYVTTSGELDVSYNYRKGREAFYGAEAGANEARYRLRPATQIGSDSIADTASPKNPNWCVYIVSPSLTAAGWTPATGDPGFTTGFTNTVIDSLQNTIPYWVKIRHKREWDAAQDGHNPPGTLHYTDNDGVASIAGLAATPLASRGNIIYYGYRGGPLLHQYTLPVAGTTTESPAEIITAKFVQN